MALEDRIRTSVDQALQRLVTDLLSIHDDATKQQLDEAAARLAEVQQRFDAELEQRVAELQAARQADSDAAIQAAVAAERARIIAEAERDRQALMDEQLAAVAAAEARAAAAVEELETVRVGEREAEMAGFSRLVESIRGLDGATSLSEVLDALGLAAARETARAAVMVVKGDRVVGWRLTGFGPRDTQPKSIDLALTESGVIGLAASSSRPVTTRSGAADGPGFEDLPADRIGMAMPVLVGGRVVAVVYADGVAADEQTQMVPSPWPEAIEVLARHAGRCLEALTAQKFGAPPPARKAGAADTTPAATTSAAGAAG